MADAMGKRNHDEVDFDSDTEEETTSARNPKRLMVENSGMSKGTQGDGEITELLNEGMDLRSSKIESDTNGFQVDIEDADESDQVGDLATSSGNSAERQSVEREAIHDEPQDDDGGEPERQPRRIQRV